jgi:uncharacterized protein
VTGARGRHSGAADAAAVVARAAACAGVMASLVRAAAMTAVALLTVLPAAAKEVPYLSGRLVDEAGLLSATARQRIEGELAALEGQAGDQVAVLIVASLAGEPLEDYSVKVAQTWKLGQKGKSNGVLLFISRDDRKMRVEVGYGLEGTLTDLRSHEILDEVIRPRFQQGDFDGGVEQGVDAIVKILHGQPLPPRPAAPAAGAAQMPLAGRLLFGALFCFIIGIFSFFAVASRGCQSWFLYLFLTPFYIAFPIAFAGPAVAAVLTAVWLIGFPIVKLLRRGEEGKTPAKGEKGGFWGGLAAGAGGGGFFSGGGFSSSGGGFSGGGGSFGGGGSSGGW